MTPNPRTPAMTDNLRELLVKVEAYHATKRYTGDGAAIFFIIALLRALIAQGEAKEGS